MPPSAVATLTRQRLVPLLTDPCIFCQTRLLSPTSVRRRRIHTSFRQLQQSSPAPESSQPKANFPKQPPTVPKPTPSRPHVRARDGELVPAPLSRPLGLPYPPFPGQNTGTDRRTWTERKRDLADYDKHLERRKSLIKDLYEKNYFRDLGNVGKLHKGKSMLAPSTPFRRDVARWFPNLRGRTLEGVEGDTTNVLRGRVSVVKVVSTEWGELQCKSFVGEDVNPALKEYLGEAGVGETAQVVEVNVSPNPLKYWLVRLFMGRQRKKKEKAQWGRYFLVSRALTDDIKEALGIWNSMVGYVYLLDGECRVRWAGNGDAREDERGSLVKCLRRLVDEAKGVQRPTRVKREDPRPTSTSSTQSRAPPAEAQSTKETATANA